MDILNLLSKVRDASRKILTLDDEKISSILNELADLLENKCDNILTENEKDLSAMDKNDPVYDRVLLDKDRIFGIAQSVREVAAYDSPIGNILEEKTLDNGLDLKKISTPLGVVGVIFEARPNVVIDVFALCFKSKNACVLKGGSQSSNSNDFLIPLIHEVLKAHSLTECALLLPNDRDIVAEVLRANEYIDVIIPRGGKGLIDFVRKNSSVPVIETGAGVVHTYFDKNGDVSKCSDIVFNAKTSRPSVCNALDTLIIHETRLEDLSAICEKLSDMKVRINADSKSYVMLDGNYPPDLLFHSNDESFGKEYLGLEMSIKTISNLNGALSHISKYGSGHSEAIVTENADTSAEFLNMVDAAAVYVNTSTRFTDGSVFGLGAEIGISTQKLHARGPMGISELTSYKWQITGNGQIR